MHSIDVWHFAIEKLTAAAAQTGASSALPLELVPANAQLLIVLH